MSVLESNEIVRDLVALIIMQLYNSVCCTDIIYLSLIFFLFPFWLRHWIFNLIGSKFYLFSLFLCKLYFLPKENLAGEKGKRRKCCIIVRE